jgi:ribonuclease-3
MKELESLTKKVGYQFKDLAYLDCALTHRSANQNHYERMEFLGDAVLNFVISSALYDQYPEATEGELSRLRAYLVKGDSLSELAIDLNLSDYLRLGSGELKSGGFRRKSILADVVESIIGAIFLDGGIVPAREFILRLFKNKLASIDASKNLKDPKTRLQEYMQARGLPLPEYEIITTSGKAHKQTFTVACKVDLLPEPLVAKGSSRRKAEQAAADQALEQLET